MNQEILLGFLCNKLHGLAMEGCKTAEGFNLLEILIVKFK